MAGIAPVGPVTTIAANLSTISAEADKVILAERLDRVRAEGLADGLSGGEARAMARSLDPGMGSAVVRGLE